MQGFTILHHSLNAIGINGTGKFIIFRLASFYNRHSQIIFTNLAINIEHLYGFFFSLFSTGMSSMSLLPQKLSCAQKQSRTHFPAHNISPLINQNRQIAIRLNPFCKTVGNNGLGSRANNQRFFQRRSRNQLSVFAFEFRVGNNRHFFGKTFNVFSFFLKKR